MHERQRQENGAGVVKLELPNWFILHEATP